MTAVLPVFFTPRKTSGLVLEAGTLPNELFTFPARITGVQRIRMTYEGFSPAKVWYFYIVGGGPRARGFKSLASVYRLSEAFPPPYGCTVTEYRDPLANYDSAVRITDQLTGTFITLDMSFASNLELNPVVSMVMGSGEIMANLDVDVEQWVIPPQHFLGVSAGMAAGSPPRKEFLTTLDSSVLDAGGVVDIPRHVGPQLIQIRVELAGFQMDWGEFYLSYGYRDATNGYIGLPSAEANPEVYLAHRCTVVQTSTDPASIEKNRTYAIYLDNHTFSLVVKPSSARAEPPRLSLLSAALGPERVVVSITKPFVTDWC